MEEDEDVGEEDNEEIMVDLGQYVQHFVIAPSPTETDDTVDHSMRTLNESELGDDAHTHGSNDQRADVGGDHSSDSVGSHQLEEDKDVGEEGNEEIMGSMCSAFSLRLP